MAVQMASDLEAMERNAYHLWDSILIDLFVLLKTFLKFLFFEIHNNTLKILFYLFR